MDAADMSDAAGLLQDQVAALSAELAAARTALARAVENASRPAHIRVSPKRLVAVTPAPGGSVADPLALHEAQMRADLAALDGELAMLRLPDRRAAHPPPARDAAAARPATADPALAEVRAEAGRLRAERDRLLELSNTLRGQLKRASARLRAAGVASGSDSDSPVRPDPPPAHAEQHMRPAASAEPRPPARRRAVGDEGPASPVRRARAPGAAAAGGPRDSATGRLSRAVPLRTYLIDPTLRHEPAART
jgi:hypothetical protein